MTVVFGVTGWKNSGKTTMVAALVKEFTKRGLSVSTIKHAHDWFDIDHVGTDSHSHRTAGAGEVAVVSPKRWALMHEIKSDGAKPSLDTILGKLAPCDIVIVEGYKEADIVKLECIRGPQKEAPVYSNYSGVIAVATDQENKDHGLPRFDIDDIPSIAEFIAEHEGVDL